MKNLITKSAFISAGLGMAQLGVGDIGVNAVLSEGGVAKTALHSGVGGVFGGKAGMIGGAVAEQMSAHILDKNDALASQKIGLAASITGALTGQDARGMQVASSTASSANEYNRRLHSEELRYLNEAKRGKTLEEQERLDQAAKAMTRGYKGVPHSDEMRAGLKADSAAGKGFEAEQAELFSIAAKYGDADAFKYSWADYISDTTSRYDEAVTRSVGAWEQKTGQKWPVYEKAIGTKKIGDPYYAHHIIQVDHGGPNEWWNIHPSHFKTEHPSIHGTGSASKAIFNSKVSK